MRIIRKKSDTVKQTRRTIALFGGAFNPPHRGHVALVKALLRCRDIDQVWVLPVYKHPFRKAMAPYVARFHMCRLAFSALSPRIRVKRTERDLGGISYTVRTLKFLTQKFSGTRFVLVMGADSYRDRAQWKDFDKIERLVDVIVFPRSQTALSSTQVRRGKIQAVPPQVRRYIKRKGLY